MQEIQQRGDPVTFDQIAGLEFAKKSVVELVCWPMARPDIFTGLRSLPKGLLLFGPPGTGESQPAHMHYVQVDGLLNCSYFAVCSVAAGAGLLSLPLQLQSSFLSLVFLFVWSFFCSSFFVL